MNAQQSTSTVGRPDGAGRRRFSTAALTTAAVLAIAAAIFAGSPAFAAHVTLAWDANAESDLAGYRIHYGTASGSYTDMVETGLVTSVTVEGLEEGASYYFAATAFDVTGEESGFSNEVVYEAEPGGAVLFADDFSDGDRSGDPDWATVSGGWSVNRRDQFAAAADLANRALVLDPAVADFGAGNIEARVKLSSTSLSTANAYLFFGWQDGRHFRYIRLKTGGVSIGQTGDVPEEPTGLKAQAGNRLSTGRWYHVRVNITETGTVAVYLDHAAEPTVTYDFAAPLTGQVGLGAKQTKAFFDDYVVRALPLL